MNSVRPLALKATEDELPGWLEAVGRYPRTMSVLPYPGPQSAEEFFAWSVADGARNPGNWIVDADALMASARLVLDGWRRARTAVFSAGMAPEAAEQMRQHPELWAADVFMMLAGMAIEDLLKAIMIIGEPTLVRPNPSAPTQMLDNSISHHDLGRLAARAGIPVNSEERAFLARLSGFVQWAGRYPLAKSLEAMAPASGSGDLRTVTDPADVDAAVALFERARAIAWEKQINEYASAQEEQRAAAREVRAFVERWLEKNTAAQDLDDGTTRYLTGETQSEPGAAIACCGAARK
jgi:hypothetical protein